MFRVQSVLGASVENVARQRSPPGPALLALALPAHTAGTGRPKWQQHACRTARKKCPAAPRQSKRKNRAERTREPVRT